MKLNTSLNNYHSNNNITISTLYIHFSICPEHLLLVGETDDKKMRVRQAWILLDENPSIRSEPLKSKWGNVNIHLDTYGSLLLSPN